MTIYKVYYDFHTLMIEIADAATLALVQSMLFDFGTLAGCFWGSS